MDFQGQSAWDSDDKVDNPAELTGALNLETMGLVTGEHGTINGASMIRFLENFQTLGG